MLTLFMSIVTTSGREVHFDDLLIQGDPIKISQAVTAARRARNKAKKVFDRSTLDLWRLEIPKDEEQRRHFPSAVLSRDEICQRTRRRPSLFYSGIRVSELQLVMYDLLEQRLYEIVTADKKRIHQRLDIDAINPIGCSRGLETTVIRYDLQFTSGVAHAYPVAADESDIWLKDGIGGGCASDILQGYERSQ